MSQLAGVLGGGGGAAVSPSSSAGATSPQSGTTGSLLLDFGGINLGNQDIPLNAQTTDATNQAPTLGSVGTASGASTLIPYILVGGAVIALVVWLARKA